MLVHCPHCGKAFEKSHFPLGDEVTCIHCEKVFPFSRKETIPSPDADDGNGGEKVRNTQLTPLPGAVEVGGQLGGYALGREIGRGGMGVVYLANQESLAREVAVKVLPRKLSEDDSFVRRFEREAHSLARLNHANIVSILDKGQEGGVYYFVMEFVDGVSLRDVMEERRLTPQEALRIVKQICDALEYAHDEGVVHRDIKPENILIDRKGNVKIADFGLARLVRGDVPHSRITRSQMVMGSPDYMAPEQRESARDVDHRADLYSVGVIFYEMLTGELPLGNFPPPSQKNLGLDVNVDRIVLKVLEKNPELRYRKASEVSTEIDSLGNGHGRRHGAGRHKYRRTMMGYWHGYQRFVKDNPLAGVLVSLGAIVVIVTLLSTLGAGVLGLAIPLAVIGWLWHASVLESRAKERKEIRKEEEARRRSDLVAKMGPEAAEAAAAVVENRPPGYSIISPVIFSLACIPLLALVAIDGPLRPLIHEEFYRISTLDVLGVLMGTLTVAIPMIALLVLGFYGRARAKLRKQKGRFFSSLAILMTIGCLIWGGKIWAEYHRGYRTWNQLEQRAAVGDEDALDLYEERLEASDFDARRATRWSLLRVEGDHAVSLQADLMNDPDEDVQYRAARVLGEKGAVALPYLIQGLQHPNEQVQYQCARALDRRLPIDINLEAIYHGKGRAAEIHKIQEWWDEYSDSRDF